MNLVMMDPVGLAVQEKEDHQDHLDLLDLVVREKEAHQEDKAIKAHVAPLVSAHALGGNEDQHSLMKTWSQ